ncbi:MAG: heavy metal translocating P-type ATPase [Halobacteria archaeon]|nr:heavy metal translocating P-type ATPase [Halobacteria archaeon]
MSTYVAEEVTGEAGATARCFHCGLPVPPNFVSPTLEVFDEPREFCCHGCHIVCKTIIDAGHADYYRHRTDPAVSANKEVVPDFLDQVELFDRPEIQQDFVKPVGDSREAALLLDNIRCPACLWLNERHLRSLPGVLDVHIDDTTQRARVRWDPQIIRLSEILRAITAIGYIAHPYDATRSEQLNRLRRRRSTERLLFAGLVGMLVMNFSLATYLMGETGPAGELPLWIVVGRWSNLLLALLLLAYPGQEFFAGAWSDLRHRRLGMDVPVVLGLSAALLGSLQATVTGRGEVYFDSIAMFIFFLLLARRYELRGKLSAADRLDRLARVTPGTASRLDDDGIAHEVPVDELAAGDHIRLLPGATLPVDGILISGISSFDESLLTGEAQPVLHQPGDAVIAGSVNGDQPVTVEVSHAVQQSAVSEIRHLVERGLELRPRYAVLAERVASGFVIVLLLIATATALYWLQTDPANWLSSTIAVLIVTCPCALALATPVALAVSAGRFIDLGVLPLRMRALDALARSDLFVFDKTGTLTRGRPAVARVVPTAGLDADACLRHAAALAAESAHPLAHALRERVPSPGLVPRAVDNVPGAGIAGSIEGREWRLGKPEFAAAASARDNKLQTVIADARARGELISVLASDGRVQAVLCFEDPPRPGVETMLAGLQDSGVRDVVILSGDAPESVQRVARQLGIDEAYGGQSPADKLAWTQAQQAQGRQLAMFGDGINDAPTLAAADVSVSFADATDLANASSDFLVLGDDAGALVAARQLARQTRRNIMQNFAWAATYNLCAVPFAAAGLIPPWGAAIGMSLSSLLVVLNALRLK